MNTRIILPAVSVARGFLFFLFFLGAVHAPAATTLVVYNHVTSAPPDKIFLQLAFDGSAIVEPAEMTNHYQVVRPFSVGMNAWTLTLHHVKTGNLRFGHDPDGVVQNGEETGYEVVYDGFVEFSVMTNDTTGWWNLSNVDWIGMLCGLRCTHGGFDPGATWTLGYNKKSAELINIIENLYEFTETESNTVTKSFPAGIKLMSPTKYPDIYSGSVGGQRSVQTYLNRLVSNQVPELLVADWWNSSAGSAPNPPGWNDRVPSAVGVEFHGGFRDHENLQAIGINDGLVVHVLSNQTYGVEMYLTTNALNAETILRGDSYGGCWVRYLPDTNQPTVWSWAITNDHLNCIRIIPEENSPFRQWCASLTKKVIYPINAGIIRTNSHPAAGEVFTYSGYAERTYETNTWQHPRYQINLYNGAIISNSDSYGMSYSDSGDQSKVQVRTDTAQNPIVELHLLDPQADPSAYYSKAKTSYRLMYQVGSGGTLSGTATQTVDAGQSGTAIEALPADTSVVFHAWSDGRIDNPRTETNVHADVTVSTLFRSRGGADLDWYTAHGFTPGAGEVWSDLDTNVVAAKGTTLLEECLADTNPQDTGDVFHVIGLQFGPPITVRFEPGSTGRLYSFEYATDLAGGLWTNVPGTTRRAGAGGEDEMQDTNEWVDGFYRLQVELP